MPTVVCTRTWRGSIDEFPELIQSRPRQRLVDEILSESMRPNLKAIQAALANHEAYPRSICRHPNNDPDTDHWQTTFSVIIETDQRRMHVSHGTPCDHPYETYALT